METIHTIETPEITAKLNKIEIDILHFIDSWLPTFADWSVAELASKTRVGESDVNKAVDMLILHGLLSNAGFDVYGRRVSVPSAAALWMRENSKTIYNIKQMIDTNLFSEDQIAES